MHSGPAAAASLGSRNLKTTFFGDTVRAAPPLRRSATLPWACTPALPSSARAPGPEAPPACAGAFEAPRAPCRPACRGAPCSAHFPGRSLPQVNTASRMESHGFPQCVHLSEASPRPPSRLHIHPIRTRLPGLICPQLLTTHMCDHPAVCMATRAYDRTAAAPQVCVQKLVTEGLDPDRFVPFGTRQIKGKARKPGVNPG